MFPLRVVINHHRLCRDILRDAAAHLKMNPYYGEKVYRQAEGFSDAELGAATVTLAELDLSLKGGSRLAPDLVLQRALIAVSRDPG